MLSLLYVKYFLHEMTMSFSEKSSWVMCISLVFGALFYGHALTSTILYDQDIQLMSLAITYTVIIVAVSIVGHIGAALVGFNDAKAPEDERDKKISIRANSISSYVLGFGAVSGILHYIVLGNGDLLFHLILISLTLSAIVEYAFRIYLYRTVI